ncbi:MAG: hypothetical protein V7638_736 [Acidobacteriota bacterium]
MWQSLFTTYYWFGFGVGRGVGRLLFTAAGRVVVAFILLRAFMLLRGVAFTLGAPAFVLVRFTFARFALIDLFALPFVLLPLAFSLVFFGFGRFGLFSFVFAEELVLRFSAGSSGVTLSDDSPALARRLMSIATVCPVFTTSPARGN